MDVQIVVFPETNVAAIEHFGPPALEHNTVRKLIAWKLEQRLPNSFGIINKVIPRNRCALARDIGSRYNNRAAVYLFERWLPQSGELPGNFPISFHYVNVGPNVREDDAFSMRPLR